MVEATGIVEDSGLEGKCRGLYFIIEGLGANGRPERLGGQEIPSWAHVSPRGVQAARAGGRRNPGQTRGFGHVPEMGILGEASDALAKSGREVTKPHTEGFRPGGQPFTNLHFSQPHPGLSGPLPVGSQAGRYVLAAKGFTPFSRGTPGVQGLDRLLRDYSCAPLGSWMSPLRIPETGGGDESGV